MKRYKLEHWALDCMGADLVVLEDALGRFALHDSEVFSFLSFSEVCPPSPDKANFLHKASGLAVEWYKNIGRQMKMSRLVTEAEWAAIFAECMASLAPDAKEKARAAFAERPDPWDENVGSGEGN